MKKWYETEKKDADVSAGTFVCLVRNLEGVPFPSRMTVSDRYSVREKVFEAFSRNQDVQSENYNKVMLESISKIQAISLAENGFISAEMVTDREGCGLILSKDESLSIAVNGEDHLMIQSKATGLNLQDVYSAADNLDTLLDRVLPFAFDPQLGYLTQNPFHLGTGMIASFKLHLPALLEFGSVGRIAQNLSKLGLTLHGLYQTELSPRGAFFRLSNQVTMGLSEKEALTNLSSIASQIISRERRIREDLIHQLSVQDAILRNFGILQNARLLSFDEFMERISAVRLGVAVGLIKDITVCEIDKIIYTVQPATLAFASGEAFTKEEHQKIRANLVREALKNGVGDKEWK